MSTLPALPKMNASLTLRRRDRLLSRWRSTSDLQERFVSVRQVLKVPAMTLNMMKLELEPQLAGPEESWQQVCWRLAGSVDWLRRGSAVGQDYWRSTSHWAAAAIISAIPHLNKKFNKPGVRLKFRILTGPAAGLICYKFWSMKALRHIARRLGFSAPWKDTPFREALEIVGMRLAIYLEPSRMRDDKPGFHSIQISSSAKAYNRRLIKSRLPSSRRCPLRMARDVQCHRCVIGKDRCGLATHPRSYVKMMCVRCAKDTPHDPDDDNQCVVCRSQFRKKGLVHARDVGKPGQTCLQPSA